MTSVYDYGRAMSNYEHDNQDKQERGKQFREEANDGVFACAGLAPFFVLCLKSVFWAASLECAL